MKSATISRRRFLATSLTAAATAGCRDFHPPTAATTEAPLRHDVLAYGAVGDGHTDDTSAIQAAIDYLPDEGGEVYVPSGTYLIDPARPIELRSQLWFNMADGAVLRARRSPVGVSVIMRGDRVVDARVSGGRLDGGRLTNDLTTCQRGFGIRLIASSNVVLANMVIENCWHDGIYLGGHSGGRAGWQPCRDIVVVGCSLLDNRRQGMSITSCVGARIDLTLAAGTAGQSPASGIDIEPNEGQVVEGVVIRHCAFRDNAGWGVLIAGHNGIVARTVVQQCETHRNASGGMRVIAARSADIVSNALLDTAPVAIMIDVDSTDVRLAGNDVRGGGRVILDAPSQQKKTAKERSNAQAARCP